VVSGWRQLLHLPTAQDAGHFFLADHLARQRGQQILVHLDRLAAEGQQRVTQCQAGSFGRAAALYSHDQQTTLLPNLGGDAFGQPHALCADAQVAAPHAPMRPQRVNNPLERGGGDGQTDALVQPGCIQPQQPAVGPHQRAAGEAGVHDDIGRQIAVDLPAHRCAPAIAQGADDAHRSLYGAARSAQGEHDVADAHLRFGGMGRRRARRATHLQHGQIGCGVAADQCGRGRLPIAQTDGDVIVAPHDVVGGDDQAVGRPENAAARRVAARLDAHNGRPDRSYGPG